MFEVPTLPPKKATGVPEKYATWIAERYATWEQAHQCCMSATKAMVESFPELKRVRGYRIPGGEHWWCETADGSIVDPTEAQFKCGEAEFFALDESQPQPSGYCAWCRLSYVYNTTYCSDECREAHDDDRSQDLYEMGMRPDPKRPGVWVQAD
jgi:hypothetical protein